MKLNDVAAALSARIEHAEQLDAPAERLNQALSALPIPDRLRSALSGTWLGHPVHPLLVATPIGCWTSASILDVIGQRDAARTLIGAGVISVAPTAATGLSDWLDTSGAERRVGLVHLGVNLAATAVYGASWWARRRGRHTTGIALAVLGAVAASAAGWAGGHLAYGLGVGVDTNAFGAGPIDWTELDVVVEDSGHLRTTVGPTPVLVASDDGLVRVLADRCSHRGAPLSDGEVADGCVTCPWHGSRFDLATGNVVRGPAVVPQPVYEVRDRDGVIEVRRDEARALRGNSTQA
jgi:nitrite reductase/ring-hydroxylating ferredoxin subunit/uncharacterized membrane protein